MFKKATRKKVFLKLAITGTSGSGKTKGALELATGLARGGKIAYIDTENGSASLYSDEYDFDACDLEPPFIDTKFVNAVEYAVEHGYKVIVIDSASHFWEGILEYKSKLDARGGNSYTNWATATDKYKKVLNAVLQSPAHLICCMRSKADYILEKDEQTGRTSPKKVGLAAVMREGAEYEFTTVFDLEKYQAKISKDRTGLFHDQVFEIKKTIGKMLLDWLDSAPDQADPTKADPETFLDADADSAPVAEPPAPKKKTLPERKQEQATGALTDLEEKTDLAGKAWGCKLGDKVVYTRQAHLGDKLKGFLNQQVKVTYYVSQNPAKPNVVEVAGIELNSAVAARAKAKERHEGIIEAAQEVAQLKALMQEHDMNPLWVLKAAQEFGYVPPEVLNLSDAKPPHVHEILVNWTATEGLARTLEQGGDETEAQEKDENQPSNLEMEAVVHG